MAYQTDSIDVTDTVEEAKSAIDTLEMEILILRQSNRDLRDRVTALRTRLEHHENAYPHLADWEPGEVKDPTNWTRNAETLRAAGLGK